MLLRNLLFFLSLFIPSVAVTEKAIDLFVVKTLVVDQSKEIRRQAASNGLSEVLVRLSGNRKLLQHPEIIRAVKNASSYLYEFSYQSTEKTVTIAGAEQPATQLVMGFSQEPLENLLKDNQLPIWSASRPELLVWMAVQNEDKRYVTYETPMGQALELTAAERGLPIVTPILDLEDRSALSAERLWAMDENSIRLAASRYYTDAVLSGRVTQDQQQWSGRFLLFHQEKTLYYTAIGDQPISIARAILDQVADYFASIYAVTPTASGVTQTVLIQINNINDFDHYAQVLNYLENMTLVQSLMLTKVDRDVMQIQLYLETDPDRFLASLVLDKKLEQISPYERNSQILDPFRSLSSTAPVKAAETFESTSPPNSQLPVIGGGSPDSDNSRVTGLEVVDPAGQNSTIPVVRRSKPPEFIWLN